MPTPSILRRTIALALTVGIASAAEAGSIEFGPPGALQTIAFHDDIVSASITFRVSPDARFSVGPAAVSPSISSGSLTVRAFGRRFRYGIATIFPIATHRIVLSKDGTCGTTAALTRKGNYLVIEAILAEKGCAPLAAFIDLADGRVERGEFSSGLVLRGPFRR